ncbi:hypothetical protein [Paracoccus zhejiangensis]|uniref:Uncharacterized protein n=1 Tax=Paracoccus zhejiangensis TaxID=1077935 RepID=A0A2H5F5Z4_9RHOB|nr:hypothetical protein [Paracoccus zhejiangensis]AUH66954.1 hypothetical protein CX676_21910 [Paracoccus zhejiangensis]
MTQAYYRITVPVEGSDGKTRFRPVGTLFAQREDAKSAFKIKLDFPVGATELVVFDPKQVADDNPVE